MLTFISGYFTSQVELAQKKHNIFLEKLWKVEFTNKPWGRGIGFLIVVWWKWKEVRSDCGINVPGERMEQKEMIFCCSGEHVI